ncbi:MAG: DUF2188 domain-containing protein [Deltaproteobacteria bacterium]|nr:DUF2188 domain-containing protein [Deltaproteobacteria bacterium]
MAKNKHVVPKGKKWAVKTAGKDEPDSEHPTQAAAEAKAKARLAAEGGGEVRIHGKDGRIRDSDTVAPGNESSTKDNRH